MDLFEIAAEANDVSSGAKAAIEFQPPREGVALLRLCSYIELGVYEGEWKGKKKHNAKVMVEFELVHPDHEIKDADGNKRGYHRVWLRINKSGNEKSKYMQLFKKLNYDGAVTVEKGKIPSMARFLGHAFMGQIYHNEYKDKVYANLDKDGIYSLGAPRVPVNDPVTMMPTGEYKDIVVPEMSVKPRLFLWEAPGMPDEGYKKMWDSIYIEGEKDDGSSKNWIQNLILSEENIALPGSKAEQLFLEGGELDDLPFEADI